MTKKACWAFFVHCFMHLFMQISLGFPSQQNCAQVDVFRPSPVHVIWQSTQGPPRALFAQPHLTIDMHDRSETTWSTCKFRHLHHISLFPVRDQVEECPDVVIFPDMFKCAQRQLSVTHCSCIELTPIRPLSSRSGGSTNAAPCSTPSTYRRQIIIIVAWAHADISKSRTYLVSPSCG